jgi:hypothetical protein
VLRPCFTTSSKLFEPEDIVTKGVATIFALNDDTSLVKVMDETCARGFNLLGVLQE